MALLHQLFTVEELKALDPKAFEILRTAIRHAIATDPHVIRAISEKVRPLFLKLKENVPPQES